MGDAVYIDILFFVNFIANYLIIITCAKILRRSENAWRMRLGAAVGALYAVFIFFPRLSPIYSLGARLLFSLTIVAVSYRYKSLTAFLKYAALFYGICFLFGGGVMAFYYLVGSVWGLRMANGAVYFHLPLPLFLAFILLCYAAIRLLTLLLFWQRNRSSLHKISIRVNGKSVTATAMVDSGNSLVDPLSQNPVVVVEYGAVRPLIPTELHPIFQQKTDRLAAELIADSGWSGRFRLVMYSSLGTGHGLLPSFKPDELTVYEENGTRSTSSVIIGVINKSLSQGGEYCALLHPQV